MFIKTFFLVCVLIWSRRIRFQNTFSPAIRYIPD